MRSLCTARLHQNQSSHLHKNKKTECPSPSQHFSQELEPFVHIRTKSQTGRSKNSPKRRSEPGNVFRDKEKENHKRSSRISWHQETYARQVRVFEEINCSDDRHSKILYELENQNVLTRSRISLVENFGKRKVLAVQVSRDSLHTNDERTFLPFPQQKNHTTVQSVCDDKQEEPRPGWDHTSNIGNNTDNFVFANSTLII